VLHRDEVAREVVVRIIECNSARSHRAVRCPSQEQCPQPRMATLATTLELGHICGIESPRRTLATTTCRSLVPRCRRHHCPTVPRVHSLPARRRRRRSARDGGARPWSSRRFGGPMTPSTTSTRFGSRPPCRTGRRSCASRRRSTWTPSGASTVGSRRTCWSGGGSATTTASPTSRSPRRCSATCGGVTRTATGCSATPCWA
jgi:hypothetical protein